jgi:hypothetical protein
MLDGAEVAQGVPRVHCTKVLLRELPAVTRVSVDRAERVTGQCVAVLERVGCGIADGGQELEKRGIFPLREDNVKLDAHMVERDRALSVHAYVPREYLQLIGNRKRVILKLGQPVKRTNFDECAYEKGCCLGRERVSWKVS